MKHILLLPLLAFPLLVCSCSSFERKWEAAVSDYQAGKTEGISGPWAGAWTTNTNGHTGNLRAIVSESKKSPGNYDFHYHATWAKIFSGGYRVSYPASRSGNTWKFDGEEKVGVFGTFRHRATVTPHHFTATYSSEKGDLGDFSMSRPR
ncbi:MAG: hypothetical protein AAGC68_05875 [Verrucomicrobiota bacterium]